MAAPKSARGALIATTVLAALTLAVAPAARAAALFGGGPLVAGALSGATAGVQVPSVTLDSLALRSHQTTPSFSGTASDTTPVTIEVFSGAAAQGKPLATLQAIGTGGAWASGALPAPLSDGTYTAIARQMSSLGGLTGVSAPVTFAIDTESPTVTLAAPPQRSNDTAPAFSGTASGSAPVTVEIYEGPRPEGRLLATAEAGGTGAAWSSAPAAPALASGRHFFTALAVQSSDTGGEPGQSAPVTFEVDTEPPKLTLAQPPSPANDTTPSFSGTTSEAGEVAIEVFAGGSAQGSPLQVVAAQATGQTFSSLPLSAPLSDGTYTAIARQASAIENGDGQSAPVTFTVETAAPAVTLNAPLSPSANRRPSFSGTASDHMPVTVEIHSGPGAEGALVASVTAEANAGSWSSGRAEELPEWGQYTAVAVQPSSIRNPDGISAPVTFSVEPIAPSVATEAAASLTRTSAALYGSVDPKGAPVNECRFEYGTTTPYPKSVGCGLVSGASEFPPAGTGSVQVFVRIYGLVPGASYHYRVVAVGDGGRADGADRVFTTLPAWLFGEEGAAASSSSAGRAPPRAFPTAARLRSLIARQLIPRGRGAHVALLLKHGAFTQMFKAPVAGQAVISWRYSPGNRRAGDARATLVAIGRASFRAPGAARITLRLLAGGRRLLQGPRHARLTASCVFTPATGPAVRVARTFQLAL